MPDNKVRLQKFMADNGIASRRKCEEYIENGQVKSVLRGVEAGDEWFQEVLKYENEVLSKR